MECIFCQLPEFQFNYLSQQIEKAKHSNDATEIICSNCLQKIFSLGKERLKEFQELNREKEKGKAVEYIQRILKEEKIEPKKRASRSGLFLGKRSPKITRNSKRNT